MSLQFSQNLKAFARDASLTSLRDLTGRQGLCLRDMKGAQARAERMSYIVAADWALKIGFRFFFNFEELSEISGVRGNLTDAIVRLKLTDFAKEFCNQTGGRLVRTLETADRPMGLSVPITNRLSGELALPKEQPPKQYFDIWGLACGDDLSAVCMLSINISDEKALESVEIPTATGEKTDADSDLEFL